MGGATGYGNVAIGDSAAAQLTSGGNNVVIGSSAGLSLTTGSNNVVIGVGSAAGSNLTTTSNNVDIANAGLAADSGIVRIGTTGQQTGVFVAGIYGTQTVDAGLPVLVDDLGNLGTLSSSRRYKEDVRPMAEASERLLKLRPVTFRYKKPNALGEKPIQYGLIAEEVAKVFPELVVLNKDGQPETVAYHLLPALLLNEFQKEHRQLDAEQKLNQEQGEKLAFLQKQIDAQSVQLAEVDALKAKLANLERLTETLAGANGAGSAQVSEAQPDLGQTAVAAR